jgi:hypothetical protein
MNRKADGPERIGMARGVYRREALARTLDEQIADRSARQHLFGDAQKTFERAQIFDSFLRDLVLMSSDHVPTITLKQLDKLHGMADNLTEMVSLVRPTRYA